jgi:hypothetical protein
MCQCCNSLKWASTERQQSNNRASTEHQQSVNRASTQRQQRVNRVSMILDVASCIIQVLCYGIYPESTYWQLLGGYFGTKYRYLGTALDPNPYWFPFLGNGAVPFSNLICRMQSKALWLPFLFCGQAQRWYSPAAFLRHNLLPSIPSIWVPKVFKGFLAFRLITWLAYRFFRPIAFLSFWDSAKNCSQLSMTSLCMSVSDVLIESPAEVS